MNAHIGPQLLAFLGQSGFAGAMIRKMSDYPPQQPPSGAGVSLGKRAGARTRKGARVGRKPYRRTGTLGRNWKMSRLGTAGDDMMSETTNLVPYAVYVEGEPDAPEGQRQTPVMAAKGWPNVRDAALAEWANYSPAIVRLLTQRDGRRPPL